VFVEIVLAILGVLFVAVMTFIALAGLMRALHGKKVVDPEGDEAAEARAAAAITVISGPGT
jgi:TRAP-type C4-dicarboxylate transport system permease small subunit